MSTPNPLVPQGTFAESATKSRTRLVVFTILAAHVVFVGVLLLQGCKRTPPDALSETTNQFTTPEPFTPPPSVYVPPTNLVYTPPAHEIPPVPTNEISPPLTNEPPPPPPPPPPAAEKEHKVAKGENFVTIGKKYGVGWKAIVEANPGVDPTKLKPGVTVLKIPEPKPKPVTPTGTQPPASADAPKIYTVQSGDNLTIIAKKFGTTSKAIRSFNGLRTDRIKVGDKLKIPAKAPAAAPAASSGLKL